MQAAPCSTLLDHARVALLFHAQPNQCTRYVVKCGDILIAAEPVQHLNATFRHKICTLLGSSVERYENQLMKVGDKWFRLSRVHANFKFVEAWAKRKTSESRTRYMYVLVGLVMHDSIRHMMDE